MIRTDNQTTRKYQLVIAITMKMLVIKIKSTELIMKRFRDK